MVPPALPAGVEDAPPADTASSSADVTSINADGVQPMLDAEISPVSVDTRWEKGGYVLWADSSVPGHSAANMSASVL